MVGGGGAWAVSPAQSPARGGGCSFLPETPGAVALVAVWPPVADIAFPAGNMTGNTSRAQAENKRARQEAATGDEGSAPRWELVARLVVEAGTHTRRV